MPSRFPPRWLNFIGLPPRELGKDPPGTELYVWGMPARRLKPEELMEPFDLVLKRTRSPNSMEIEEAYVHVPLSWDGVKAGHVGAIRLLYHT